MKSPVGPEIGPAGRVSCRSIRRVPLVGGLWERVWLSQPHPAAPPSLPYWQDRFKMARNKDSKRTSGDNRVSKAVVSRLSLYLRELQRLERDGIVTTSSNKLGEMLGFTDAQVRKDLANFGQFGYPGVGYRCSELIATIRQIMGTDQRWPVALVGVGNLGRALLGYRGFSNQGFHVVAAFDLDPRIVGTELEAIPVYHVDDVARIVAEKSIQLAILAVPPTAAQEVAEQITMAGIRGILNFASVMLKLPEEITVIGVDLAIEMEQLSFAMTSRLVHRE